MLERLILKYCDIGGSSRGMRCVGVEGAGLNKRRPIAGSLTAGRPPSLQTFNQDRNLQAPTLCIWVSQANECLQNRNILT